MSDLILEVKNLRKYFPLTKGIFLQKYADLKALEDISFILRKKQTIGIVGESGCGKSTLSRVLSRIYKPSSGSYTYYFENGIKNYY